MNLNLTVLHLCDKISTHSTKQEWLCLRMRSELSVVDPVGMSAAIKAAQLGGSVCLIEKSEWGGTCLNRGLHPNENALCCC